MSWIIRRFGFDHQQKAARFVKPLVERNLLSGRRQEAAVQPVTLYSTTDRGMLALITAEQWIAAFSETGSGAPLPDTLLTSVRPPVYARAERIAATRGVSAEEILDRAIDKLLEADAPPTLLPREGHP